MEDIIVTVTFPGETIEDILDTFGYEPNGRTTPGEFLKSLLIRSIRSDYVSLKKEKDIDNARRREIVVPDFR